MPATSLPISGKGGSFFANGTEYQIKDWSIDYEVEKIDVTNFMSRASGEAFARQKLLAGVSKSTVSVNGLTDGYISALTPGNYVTCRLGITGGHVIATSLPALVIRISKADYKMDLKGAFEVSFSGESLTNQTTSATTTT